MKKSTCQLFMFLLGLGSATKIYLGGAIAFSELAVFSIAPILLFKHWDEYKRDGFLPILILPLMMILGCFISCQCNNVPMLAFIKASMIFYSIFAAVAVFYILLRRKFSGVGLFFLGVYISQIISVFWFNPHVLTDGRSTELLGQVDFEEQLEGVLFWYPKITRLLYLPIQLAYLSLPTAYSCLSPVVAAIVSISISVSGRGAAAMALMAAALMFYCRKSRLRMLSIGRHFFLFVFIGLAVVLGIKSLYSYTAQTGLLGEESRRKYEVQTRGDNSFMRILIGGRTEFFIAIRAMIDNPIVGIGPYARDTKGYTQEFLRKYGTVEDFENYNRQQTYLTGVELVPQHSVVTQFWGTAGIAGLVFCLYYLYLVYLFFRRCACCIPQWFGYFAIAIPPSLFTLFFNPYSDRMVFPLLLTCLLLSRAVSNGRLRLPVEMEMEARKYE